MEQEIITRDNAVIVANALCFGLMGRSKA